MKLCIGKRSIIHHILKQTIKKLQLNALFTSIYEQKDCFLIFIQSIILA